jgi:glucose dehydrogenase
MLRYFMKPPFNCVVCARRGFAVLVLLSAIAACTPRPGSGNIDTRRLFAADSHPEDWMTSGRDFGKGHYSPLKQINAANVSRLGVAWEYDTGTTRGLEATPIVVDGVLYTSGVAGRVYALEGATGRLRWKFVPSVNPQTARKACCDEVNRGVAVWRGKVYVAALDGELYALDAGTGAILWKRDTIIDHTRGYTSTGAPEVAGNVVVIGNAGGEFDARGYVSAYGLDGGGSSMALLHCSRPTGSPIRTCRNGRGGEDLGPEKSLGHRRGRPGLGRNGLRPATGFAVRRHR